MHRHNTICMSVLLLACSTSLMAQLHGVSELWDSERAVAKLHPTGSTQGGVSRNFVVDRSGTITIFLGETYPYPGQSMTPIYTGSTDGGRTWNSPSPSTIIPITKVVGPSVAGTAIDSSGNIHIVFAARSPKALFYASRNKQTGQWSDTIRVSDFVRYDIAAPNITIDRRQRIHILWHDGDPGTANIAESNYTRSTDGGIKWQPQQILSADDGKQSAFPRAKFEACIGDSVAIAWRDSVGGPNAWDVVIAYSTNGGMSWQRRNASGGPGSQWDPEIVMGADNVVHLSYHLYPAGNFFNASIWYGNSTDLGATWNTRIGGAFKQISAPNIRSQLLVSDYEPVSKAVWILWKDERDFDRTNGNAKADIIGAYSMDNGITWSSTEFVSDLDSINARYHQIVSAPDGAMYVTYNYGSPLDNSAQTVYIRKRKPNVTEITAAIPDRESTISLTQNYPNPFSDQTTIALSLQASERLLKSIENVSLRVYDVFGREVLDLTQRAMMNDVVVLHRNQLPCAGLFFYRLEANGVRVMKVMIAR